MSAHCSMVVDVGLEKKHGAAGFAVEQFVEFKSLLHIVSNIG
jgi:hypothetical protein